MHLGLYQEPVSLGPEGYETYGPFALCISLFARRFEQVTVFAPTATGESYFSGHRVDQPNVTVAPLPFYMTHAQAYRRYGAIKRVFAQHADTLDAVVARGTAPLAYLLWRMVRDRNVPFVYHFASDPFEIIARSRKYRGLYGLFARAAYGFEFAIQKRIVRRNFAFASGEALAARLRESSMDVQSVITSALRDEDFYVRADCCLARPVRLLFVGYLRPEKRVEDLLEAVRLLRERGTDAVADVVGSGEHRPALETMAQRLGVREHVTFHGHAVAGRELNSRYEAADVLVFPSLSEGSPKVVLEAMAHSLPVVATGAGNIPEMLAGGERGLIVPRDDPPAVAEAVARLIDDGDLRRRFIRDGYSFAREHSAEAFVGEMADKVRALVEQRRAGEAAR
jgi:glycosyltransferase involved in cell wall biosynthesis